MCVLVASRSHAAPPPARPHLKVAAAQQHVDFDSVALLGRLDGGVDGVQLAMAAALDSNLATLGTKGEVSFRVQRSGRRAGAREKGLRAGDRAVDCGRAAGQQGDCGHRGGERGRAQSKASRDERERERTEARVVSFWSEGSGARGEEGGNGKVPLSAIERPAVRLGRRRKERKDKQPSTGDCRSLRSSPPSLSLLLLLLSPTFILRRGVPVACSHLQQRQRRPGQRENGSY